MQVVAVNFCRLLLTGKQWADNGCVCFQEVAEVQSEVTDLVQLLTSRQGELASMLNGFPQLRSTIWFSEASQQAAVQSLTPQMTENRGKVCLDSCQWLQGCELGCELVSAGLPVHGICNVRDVIRQSKTNAAHCTVVFPLLRLCH